MAARSSGGPVDPDLRVTLNFHPDRLVLAGGLLVLEAMGRDGRYRSQFEAGTSNGGLTAYPGGGRWSWESRIFGAAYDDAPAATTSKTSSGSGTTWRASARPTDQPGKGDRRRTQTGER